MKGKLLFAFALASGLPMLAASPYVGSEPAAGKYYLYQVESGKWLQPNMSKINQWTTHAELGEVGIEIELKKPEGQEFTGWQIYCDFNNNGELNGSDEDRFFLDQERRDLTDWIFTKEGEGYTIMVKAKDGSDADYNYNWDGDQRGEKNIRSKVGKDTFIGWSENGEYGGLSDADDLDGKTWQLVSADERKKVMQQQVANGNVEASWLIPWYDRGRNDHRENQWNNDWTKDEPKDGDALDGSEGYPVQEKWNGWTGSQTIKLTGLPNGTYAFAVQGFYRDADIEESTGIFDRHIAGNENLSRVSYFAGDKSANLMSVLDDPTKGEFFEAGGEDIWRDYDTNGENEIIGIPNKTNTASILMFNKHYINPDLIVFVKDGELELGIKKTGSEEKDWLVTKRFYLKYISTNTLTDAELLEQYQKELNNLVNEAKNNAIQTAYLTKAISTAENAAKSATKYQDVEEIIKDLQDALNLINVTCRDNILAYNATKKLGVTSAEADALFNEADSPEGYANALKTLRYARRRAAAETHADVFKGNEPAEGSFYLYNVGQKQFLQGGSDWGAHAALGVVGVELTLSDKGVNDNGNQKYLIETGLYNGDDNHFLSYRGYMDSEGVDNGGFSFLPVNGQEGVYYMVQGDYPDVYVVYDHTAGVDGGQADETTVNTEYRGSTEGNADAMWKLVTKAEREALMKDATPENPVDVTFLISSPSFNNRENKDAWYTNNFGIWEAGENHYDFMMESYDSESAELNQEVEGLPAGTYQVSVQGFYRNGNHAAQANVEKSQNAIFFAGDDKSLDVALPNITAEDGNAPGEGNITTATDGTSYEIPDGIMQASAYFKSGLYKTSIKLYKEDESPLSIGVVKDTKGEDGDWVVVDNFRMVYYGPQDTTAIESLEQELVPSAIEDGKVYNLQGMQVNENNLVPGIYIKNGKKFVVR